MIQDAGCKNSKINSEVIVKNEMCFRRTIFLGIITVFLVFAGCAERSDYSNLAKIDAHLHIRYNGPELLQQAQADHFKVISILVDSRDIPPQEAFIKQQRQFNAKQLAWVTTFPIQGWDAPDWQEQTLNQIKQAFADGAIGVKVWKNIGMVFRDQAGQFVMIDHPRFDPIFDYIESQNKTLTGHIGEPRDCWLPLEDMRSKSNQRYYQNHPEYHMYLHPEYPSYDDQINSYSRMLEKHPKLRYVACHLGSIEWNLTKLAQMLDRFPNMAVDLAARIDDLQILDRNDVRDFFITYQDRILYGTDLGISENEDPEKFCERAHEIWQQDWTYFATDSVMTLRDIDHNVQGLALPPDVLAQIYRDNARRWYRVWK